MSGLDFRPVLFTVIAMGLLVAVIVVTRKLAQARSGAAELSRKNRELATLRELTSIVSSVAPGEEILARLFDTLRQALPIRPWRPSRTRRIRTDRRSSLSAAT